METLNTAICELDHYDCHFSFNFRKLFHKTYCVKNALKKIIIVKIWWNYVKISVYANKDTYAKIAYCLLDVFRNIEQTNTVQTYIPSFCYQISSKLLQFLRNYLYEREKINCKTKCKLCRQYQPMVGIKIFKKSDMYNPKVIGFFITSLLYKIFFQVQ